MSPGGAEERITPLTIFTALKPWATAWLRFLFWVSSWAPLPRWTLLRLKLIHHARWAVLTHLPRPYLFFESNFNGTWHGYIDAFSDVFPRGMRAIWGGAYGFPGAIPADGLKDWIQRGELQTSHYYRAYPDASTKEILGALEVRDRLRELMPAADSMAPAEFARRYHRVVSDVQRHI